MAMTELHLKFRQGTTVELVRDCETAARTIAELPVYGWPGWVAYVLEVLDGEADDAEYRQVLERLRVAITTRLEAGRW
jgi:hypothetical protein